MSARIICRAVAVAAVLVPTVARACDNDHEDDDIDSNAVWPTLTSAKSITGAAPLGSLNLNDPTIDNWKLSTGGTGHSPNTTINNIVNKITADVEQVAYTSTNVYVRASGVPSHDVGPFPGNPAAPSDRNRTFRLPRTPTAQTGAHTATGLGAIGVMVNGVPFFNGADANSYNNAGVWHQNANVVEAVSFDSAPGHPAPLQGQTGNPIPGIYHYHQDPLGLLKQLDPSNTGQHHSPLLGYAFDGFPVYGPYGYANSDGTGGIKRIASSYAPRNITQRTTLPDGSTASSAGPAVSTTYPLGYYLEDYAYTSGFGDLDQYNGRFTVTPEYPNGTYAYFATMNADGTAAYPYIVGPQYYGVLQTDDVSGNITVPGNAVLAFLVPETLSLALFGLLSLTLRRRKV
jgi:hypothetical protein